MAVTESFLVNTDSFNSIIEALVERDEKPEKITDELFISMGFEGPSDLLVIHMLKELELITVDGEPTELYSKLINPDTTDAAIATGIINAYTDLFEKNREFHKLQKDEIHEALESYFQNRKTELIIKYMTNTFHKLITYAGLNKVQKAVDEYFDQAEEPAGSAPASDEGASPEDEMATAENEGQEQILEEDLDVVSAKDINPEDEEDADFDEIFLGENTGDEEPEEISEETEVPERTSEKNKNGSINFDELPQVRQEEKGSKNIDDLLDQETAEEPEEAPAEEPVSENSEETIPANEEQEDEDEDQKENENKELIEAEADEEPVSSENKKSLEKELLEIKNMESTNGHNKNGAENKEKEMTNFTDTTIPTNEKVEKALIKKAELLYKLERFEDVLPAYKDIVSFFDDSEKDHLKDAVARAVINRVTVLNKLNRENELLPALDEVIKRFENSATTEYYEQASMAMLQKSQLLEDESDDVLLPLFESIINRLKNASNPKIKTQVDEIFVSRVDILTETGDEHKLLDAVDELIDRFRDSQVHTGQLEQAMYKKAEILEGLNRDEEALEAYSQFLDKFGKTTELV